MDRFEAMSLFLDVIDHGGFSAAARARGLPVATVSRRIADLEASIGAQLLVRTTRKVSLSAAGEAYATAAREILADLDEAERRATGEFIRPKGELTISAPLELGRRYLLPIILGFMDEHPEIRVRLESTDRHLDLSREPIDLALRTGGGFDRSLTATLLGELRVAACCAPALLEQFGRPRTFDELLRLPQIAITSTPTALLHRTLGSKVSDLGLLDQKNYRLRVETPDEGVEAARRGAGVIFLMHFHVADAIEAGELVSLLPDKAPSPLPVHLIHAQGPLPLKSHMFIEYAAPRIRKLLDDLMARGSNRS